MTRRSILITGCSSGIGADAARTLHARGWQVFASCRAEADCERLRAEGLRSPRLDYDAPDTIRTALAQVLEATGGTLDAVFNNGAFAIPGAVEDVPREALRAIFETNLFGVHDLTRAVIPVMRAQRHGRIINCSSVLGFVPMKWRGAYVSTKYAMEGLSDVLRLEMAETGIDVVLIEPGPITSRIRENSRQPFETWIDWQGSARKAQYEASLLKRLYRDKDRPDTFELPPAAVTRKLIRALEAPRPRPRYRVTTPTHLMALARRVLTTRALDRIIARG
ncbi:SDR family NAD(P)-dependent oxidoreductase [Salibaculum halophilum]|uniref:SDR family NAD(P)-dependent oxidoreductase n=1 Tax=Salibaculum halophilum TaxID=1914408 RepID=UPI000A117F58|nr:SDR family NAD(P)-dependent oxidoreductase [Salibaculum halophilum]